jgi:hypothetical protein
MLLWHSFSTYLYRHCPQAVVMTLEAISGPTEEKMARLLKSLSDAVIITPDQMERVSVSLSMG